MTKEPVLTAVTGVVAAGIALLVAFGVDFTTAQTGAITGFVAAVYAVAVLVRSAVTPVKKLPRDPRGRYTISAIAPVGLLAAAHPDVGLLFVILAVLFVLGALYLAVQLGEYIGAVVCVVIAILILAFLA